MSNSEQSPESLTDAGPPAWLRPLALAVLALILSVVMIGGVADERGNDALESSFTRAMLVFGVARALNGVISVAQDTEIALQPGGVGVTLAPGQVLDPVNDLIERFSWIMLASAVALGLLLTLLEASQWDALTAVAVVMTYAACAAAVFPTSVPQLIRRWLTRIAIVAVFARLCVPLIAIGMHWSYDGFLASRYESNASALQDTTRKIEAINDESVPNDSDASFWDRTREMMEKARTSLDLRARMERYRAVVATTTRNTIDLTVVFLLETILIPLALIAAAWYLLKALLART